MPSSACCGTPFDEEMEFSCIVLHCRECDKMLKNIKEVKISNENIKELRFLLYGPVGAAKSSTINTIKSIFAGRKYVNSQAATRHSKSHTLCYEKFVVKNAYEQSFAFFDMMGLEKTSSGLLVEDIISSLEGHVKEGYEFNESKPLQPRSEYFIANPSLGGKMHCLLCVVPADTLSLMDKELIDKMDTVREKIKSLGILQVVFLTRVDCACPVTKTNLQDVYKSKKIKGKMEECSNTLHVPVDRIFPIQNYHEETNMNDDINCLMLDALSHIVLWANDYVEECSNK